MRRFDADIAVIGLGPAGSAAAAAAASAGLRVIALDRKAVAGTPAQCAEFVPAMIGVDIRDLSASTVQAIEEMITFIEDGAPDVTSNFRGRMIDRAAFDARLAAKAEAAGAERRYGVKVEKITDDGEILLSSGEGVRARIIIGADGPRSLVGRAIGSINYEIVETRQMRVALNAGHFATDIFIANDIPGGYGWLFPKGDYANLGLGVAENFRALLKPSLEALRRRLIDEGRIGEEIYGHTGGPIPVGGLIRAVSKLGDVGVLLAGDAAGLANPVTGAGIASAVMSGKLAGEAAAAALAGDDDAFDDYEDELQSIFGPALERALRHRKRLQALADQGPLSRDDFKSGWIAYPEYWAA